MSVTSGLVQRTLVIPLSVSRDPSMMASFWSQIAPLVYSDSAGPYAYFVNHFYPDSTTVAGQQGATVIWWLMTPSNDSTFVTSVMPGLLTAAGLSSIQTYTETVSAGY